jgi:hypothetical protein
MNEPDKQTSGKETPQPRPSRLDEARQLIQEYAGDLRNIIKKLRRHLN